LRMGWMGGEVFDFDECFGGGNRFVYFPSPQSSECLLNN